MPAPFSVALTGGIGSGKTTVTNLFSDLGVPVIDSDILAKKIVEKGKPAFNEIIKIFGEDVKSDNGSLDRKKMANLVFSDAKAKTMLEYILHPSIYEEIKRQINQVTYPYCIVVIPLLIETGDTNQFNRILLVDVPEELQIERTLKRDKMSLELVQKIIKSQAKRNDRIKYADDIIDNDTKIDELKNTVELLHHRYLDLSSKF